MPEVVDQKARSDIDAHKAVCEVIRDQQAEHNRQNREDHKEIIEQIKDLGALLGKYDKHAVYRWIIFGGTILAIIGTAIANHWFSDPLAGWL